ncbi:hypothetical protein SAMN05216474_0175 [Lishizhenia tianjinensis]|uniref:Uncharacterized protein n=2 Tax=Lishizhenia tianjinensis TaxID=477690 RepID=A0A1I6XFW5_9FLAO|nr:hypothetical protein SAMN05216474_0175 [Lishizhenia tianjinensis]
MVKICNQRILAPIVAAWGADFLLDYCPLCLATKEAKKGEQELEKGKRYRVESGECPAQKKSLTN